MSHPLERRLRVAATLVLIGLVVELVSLTWHAPLAFILFVGVGGLAMAVGVVLFLYCILISPRPEQGA